MNINLDIKEFFRANKTRAAYGIGDYAICLYWSGVSLYLLYFYTDVVGIFLYTPGSLGISVSSFLITSFPISELIMTSFFGNLNTN